MESNFRIDIPFEKKPPRLKDLVSKHVMGDVWLRAFMFLARKEECGSTEK